LKNIFIYICISLLVSIGVVSLSNSEIPLGTTVTQITGSDKLSDLDTLINTVTSQLNIGKIEVSTTTNHKITTMNGLTSASNLATIGTITSGTWNGTTITVANGGTGSTTLGQYRVLLGGGSSLSTVQGLGDSGQSLVSTGAGSAPTWQTVSFDTTANYNLSGNWYFAGNASTTNATSTNFAVTGATHFAGVDYRWPSSQIASGTVLTTNNSGNLSWDYESWFIASSTVTEAASSSISIANLPNTRLFHVFFFTPGLSSAGRGSMYFNSDLTVGNYSSASVDNGATAVNQGNATQYIRTSNQATTSGMIYDFDIYNVASFRKVVHFEGANVGTGGSHIPYLSTGAGSWSDASNRIVRITMTTESAVTFDVGTTVIIYAKRP